MIQSLEGMDLADRLREMSSRDPAAGRHDVKTEPSADGRDRRAS